MKTRYDFIEFHRYPHTNPKAKTKVFTVHNIKSGATIGWIRWGNGWRRYVLETNPDCIFDADCLRDVIHFINQLMKEREA